MKRIFIWLFIVAVFVGGIFIGIYSTTWPMPRDLLVNTGIISEHICPESEPQSELEVINNEDGSITIRPKQKTE